MASKLLVLFFSFFLNSGAFAFDQFVCVFDGRGSDGPLERLTLSRLAGKSESIFQIVLDTEFSKSKKSKVISAEIKCIIAENDPMIFQCSGLGLGSNNPSQFFKSTKFTDLDPEHYSGKPIAFTLLQFEFNGKPLQNWAGDSLTFDPSGCQVN